MEITKLKNPSKKGTAFGVAINDLPSSIIRPNGKNAKFYSVWSSMIQRCYSKDWHKKYPTYIGCTVCEEWLTLSTFKEWFEENYVEGYQLDKDFLSDENKRYSPETCVFVPKDVNTFICSGSHSKNPYLMGAIKQRTGKFTSQIAIKTESGRCVKHLGTFDTELQAHLAWKAKKHELALDLIKRFPDLDARVKHILQTKYAPLQVVQSKPTITNNLDFLNAA